MISHLDSVIIKNVKPLESKTKKISKSQMEQFSILNDQDDELEIVIKIFLSALNYFEFFLDVI